MTSTVVDPSKIGKKETFSVSSMQEHRLEAMLGRSIITKLLARTNARHGVYHDRDAKWVEWTITHGVPDAMLRKLQEALPSDLTDPNINRLTVDHIADELVRAWFKDQGMPVWPRVYTGPFGPPVG